jgi:CBS domain-containing protein
MTLQEKSSTIKSTRNLISSASQAVNMAIAIRMDAAKTSLKSLVDKYAREGQPAIGMECPEPNCGQQYLVYHGPAIGEKELREGLAPYLERDHPKHPVIYEIDESTQDDLRKMGVMDVTPLYPALHPSSTKVRDVMTKDPVCCLRSDTVQYVASLMRDKDVGCLPVVEEHSSRRLIGIITDRDVCCRAIAEGHDPNKTAIEPYVTRKLVTCLPDDDLERFMELLHKYGIRRVPVVNEGGQCIGIVAPPDVPDKPAIVVRREFARAIGSTLKKYLK